MTPIFRYVLTLALLIPAVAGAKIASKRDADAGYPFYLQHFTPQQYRAYPQNWVTTQDQHGIIYVGNYDGVLVYDGVSWDLIRTPGNTTVRSLAVSPENHVYVGVQGEFGVLSPDSSGRLVFESLSRDLASIHGDFKDVWGTHATDEYVFFQTHSKIFRWDGKRFFVWETGTQFHTSFSVGGEIYVREKGVGLLRVRGDELERIPGGERFADTDIYVVARHSGGRLLIGTRTDGLFLHDGSRLERYQTEADRYLQDHRLYHGITLPGDYVALGMLDGGGLMIIDGFGKIVEHLTEGYGLPDGWVNHVFRDAQGGLWLALNSQGIVRADVMSQITRYDSETGLDGMISEIVRFNGSIYVGTSAGLFVLNRKLSSFIKPKFERVKGIYQTSELLAHKGSLLVASHSGLFNVQGNLVEQIAHGTFYSLSASEESGRFYAGSKSGVALITNSGGRWRVELDLITVGEVRSLVEDARGHIWMTTRMNRVVEAVLRDGEYEIRDYRAPGVHDLSELIVERFGDDVRVLTSSGLFAPEFAGAESTLRFIGYESRNQYDSLLTVSSPIGDKRWVMYNDGVEAIGCVERRCEKEAPAVLRYPKWARPARIHGDSTGILWISSGSVLVRYDPDIDSEKSYEARFPVVVRRIMSIDSNHLVFGRMFGGAEGGGDAPALAFENNALRFEFALPSYNDVSGNEYQFYLEGKEAGWSAWTKETSKSYTNIFEGTYRFHVRGRNAQGYISPETVYTFRIVPPWYRSIWAYGAYLIAVVALGLFARQYRSMVVENQRAKEQANELVREKEINERLNDLNRRLQQANETLRQADRMKDEFLANTSHELRTPLTGILGCASILREEMAEDQHEFIDMIDENGQRLLRTLDSLLDLARLRAGMMELDYVDTDIGEKAASVAGTFAQLAAKKGVELNVNVKNEVRAEVDDHCLDCILNHLVGNAIKFTDEGRIDISVSNGKGKVAIEVRDTGVGIDAEFLPFLFDEFKQESTGLTRSHEGSGLGLAVTARIIELMGGEIEVRSEKGAGSTFAIHLPTERLGAVLADGNPLHVAAIDRGTDRAAA